MTDKPNYLQLAEIAAQAQGCIFYIGVRPFEKGWFAHCNGIEWDGATPEEATFSVIKTLAENAKRAAFKAGAYAKSFEQQARDLADTLALINDEKWDESDDERELD